MLDCFVEIAPTPLPRFTEERVVDPDEDKITGFVFKIFANMDPRHRDRIAFLRICCGKFERNKNYRHMRLGRDMKFPNPTMFMASKKTLLEEAYPGDVVGLYDSGNFKIGDTLTEGEPLHFKGIPAFSPEHVPLRGECRPAETKAIRQRTRPADGRGRGPDVHPAERRAAHHRHGGALQFEVIQHRLESEYGAKCRYEPVSLHKACWITAEDPKAMAEFLDRRKRDIAKDSEGALVFLAETAWTLQTVQEAFPKIAFHFTSEG